jgi:hypothetical protein
MEEKKLLKELFLLSFKVFSWFIKALFLCERMPQWPLFSAFLPSFNSPPLANHVKFNGW